MPSSSSRSRVPVRRSPRPAPRGANAATAPGSAPWPSRSPPSSDSLLTVEILLAGLAALDAGPGLGPVPRGPVLLRPGRRGGRRLGPGVPGPPRGWVVLAVAAVLPLLALLAWSSCSARSAPAGRCGPPSCCWSARWPRWCSRCGGRSGSGCGPDGRVAPGGTARGGVCPLASATVSTESSTDRCRRRGGGAGRPGRHRRAGRRRQAGGPGRPGARGVLRRAGLVVLRRAVPHRLPGAAAAAGARLPGAGPAGLARHRRLRPRPRTTGRASGPRPTCSSRRGRSGPGSRSRASGSSRSSAGPSAAATAPPGTATRCRASTSSGAPGRASSSRSPGGCAPRSTPAWSSCASGTGSPSWSSAGGAVTGVRGAVLEPSGVARGEASSRTEVERLRDQRAGGRRHLRRHRRQPRPGPQELAGPAGPGAAAAAVRRPGVTSTATCSRRPRPRAPAWSTSDRMWHYTEGIANHSPVWAQHGIRILPGPSSLWLDATGKRLPVPLFPGFDTLGHAGAHRDDGLRAHLVRRHAQDRGEGVRALRAPSRTPT